MPTLPPQYEPTPVVIPWSPWEKTHVRVSERASSPGGVVTLLTEGHDRNTPALLSLHVMGGGLVPARTARAHLQTRHAHALPAPARKTRSNSSPRSLTVAGHRSKSGSRPLRGSTF